MRRNSLVKIELEGHYATISDHEILDIQMQKCVLDNAGMACHEMRATLGESFVSRAQPIGHLAARFEVIFKDFLVQEPRN